jgi:hypothetical protein
MAPAIVAASTPRVTKPQAAKASGTRRGTTEVTSDAHWMAGWLDGRMAGSLDHSDHSIAGSLDRPIARSLGSLGSLDRWIARRGAEPNR